MTLADNDAKSKVVDVVADVGVGFEKIVGNSLKRAGCLISLIYHLDGRLELLYS